MSSHSSDHDHSPPPRNPSPPPVDKEEVLKGDLIPGTAYSKRWLFATFLKLLKKIEGLQLERASSGASNGVSDYSDGKLSSEKSEEVEVEAAAETKETAKGPSVSPSAHQSPLTDEKLNELLPSGYEVLNPPSPVRPGDKIDEETEGELCQVGYLGLPIY